MKHILVDCTTLSKKTDGLTQYTLSIVLEFLKHTCDTYTLLCVYDELPDKYMSQLSEYSDRCFIEYVNIAPIGPKRDCQFKIWFRKNGKRFDSFYEPSAQYPTGVKGGIYTVHDILYEEFPEKLGKYAFFKKMYLHHVVHRGLKKSTAVIAVSEYTKSEIIKYHNFKGASEKIHVIYEGYEHLESIEINNNDKVVQTYLNSGKKYFLYIGSSRGHKNLHNLFLAYEKAYVDWNLIIVGRMDRLDERDKKLVEYINKHSGKIIFTGWLEENQMYTILSNAGAFVFPSKSEGFGIPVLESYFFNVPLLCSDIPVFNEVAGNASIKFNPFSVDDISLCLESFCKISEAELSDLLQKQNAQLRKYSWKSAATVIHELLVKETANNKYPLLGKEKMRSLVCIVHEKNGGG